MTSVSAQLFKKLALPVAAEAVVFNSIPETSDKGDISDLRYMESYTVYLKNTHGTNSIDVQLEISPDTVAPEWIVENAYQTIAAGATLVIQGTTKDILAMQLKAKETLASNPGTLSCWIVYKQRM